VPDPAQLVQHPAQLWLEHDDDGDDDVEGGVPEKPRQEDEVELRGDDSDDRQQDETHDDLRALGASEQPQHEIKYDRDHRDVEHLDDAQMADHVVQLR
jgi:hypothetical protein